ncbi:peptidoglycan-binding protein [Hyphomonas sp.]|uniref:peptidoglycan-binding protein n=1 Tax=Hyphomonas sp. TaxID=87 RepID=UPI003001C302
MSQTGPWSVKGIDQRARDAAREAAHAEGITLGEYLNRLLMSVEAPRPNEVAYPFENRRPTPNAANDTLDKLTRRIEATEARSTLAITGMDHTILGLVARLEDAEQNSSAISGHVEGLIEELRETHSALQSKVQKLEADDSSRENLEALKSLEQALGKLASHVFEESELAQNETQAIKGRVETGFADLTDRVESMEVKVEHTLSDAASRVERAVDQAELRAEGTARELADRLSNLETHVNLRLSGVDKTDERLAGVEARVAQSMESVEDTLTRTQDRLNRAETTTDAALLSLESTFNNLDAKIETLSKTVEPDLADRLRAEFESRFEEIMSTVRSTVDTARAELAEEIARAATGTSEETVADLKSGLDDVREKLTAGEDRQIQDMDAVSSEIKRIGDLVGSRMEDFGANLDKRVNASEQRSAEAISQIGDQVATVASRLQARQDKALQTLAGEIDENRKRADQKLSEALSGISERLEEVQTQTAVSLSPIQKAMASLATRLEMLEDSAVPFESAKTEPKDLATMEAINETDRLLEEFQEDDNSSDFLADEYDAEFEPGLPQDSVPADDSETFLADWTQTDEPVEVEAEADAEPQSKAYEEDYDLAGDDLDADSGLDNAEDDFYDAFSETGDDEVAVTLDPMVGLDDYEDSRTEARESDIFEDDEFDTDTDSAEEVRALTETEESAPKPEEPAANYIDMARRAAIAASSGRKDTNLSAGTSTNRADKGSRLSGNGKLPLYAAASAVVITGAAVGGYLYLRGKQAPAAVAEVSAPADMAAISVAEADAPQTDDTAIAEDALLFEEDGIAPFETETGVSDPELVEPVAETEAPIELVEPTPVLASARVEPAKTFSPIPPVGKLANAAATGNGIAQFQLAQQQLSDGNLKGGAALMRESADKGLPIAQYTLSKLHEKGTGVPKDLTLARDWTEKAARGGNVKAMHDLAVFMAEGEGGDQTYAGAVEWFRKGAEFGIVDSQYNLGVLYEQGLGISPNLTEALYWFMIAAKNGDAGAPAKVMELSQRVSQEAVNHARVQSEDWRPSRANAAANGRFGAQAWNLGNPAQVRATQLALTALGYNIGSADGALGPDTAAAIRDYQSSQFLTVTGSITPELIENLNARAQQ